MFLYGKVTAMFGILQFPSHSYPATQTRLYIGLWSNTPGRSLFATRNYTMRMREVVSAIYLFFSEFLIESPFDVPEPSVRSQFILLGWDSEPG
jgi:hypothetical protein